MKMNIFYIFSLELGEEVVAKPKAEPKPVEKPKKVEPAVPQLK